MIRLEKWQPADELVLEPNAIRAAKELVRSLAVTAGPGAGKTEMMAQRADFLLRTGTCRYPKRILAICFKTDASRNLKARVRRRCSPELAARLDSHTFHAFAKRIIDRFRVMLPSQDALDADYQIGQQKIARKQICLDELIPLAVEILANSAIARNAIRQTYSDVFLDEFQDCTAKQYDLVKLAFHGTTIRLTAVGDTKQKIMGWAGAVDGIFETFAADFNAIVLNMYRNHRSRPRLLQIQNEIIRVMDPPSAMPADLATGNDGEVAVWRFSDDQEEAEVLADSIDHWTKDEGVPPSEIAVLVSKQLEQYAAPLMAALEARGIPYRNEQHLQDLSVEPAARLIADYLLCVYGQREPGAWGRLMELITSQADEGTQTSARRDLQSLLGHRRKHVALIETLGDRNTDWWGNIKPLFDKIGLDTIAALSPDYASKRRLEEVIRDTKVRLDELLKVDRDLLNALRQFAGDDTIRILTIHKSKGLEFDSVVILGVERETFWGNSKDERSAYFVGVSRAKRRLILTHANYRKQPEKAKYWTETRTPHSEFLGYAEQSVTDF